MLAAWEVEGTTDSRREVTDRDVDRVCRGELPWHVDNSAGLQNGSLAAQQYYGRQYRLRKAQLDRTLEEKDILSKEVVRTFNWLEGHIDHFLEMNIFFAAHGATCAAAVAAHEAAGERGAAGEGRRKASLALGNSALAARELARFKLIKADATVRLGTYLPQPPTAGGIPANIPTAAAP